MKTFRRYKTNFLAAGFCAMVIAAPNASATVCGTDKPIEIANMTWASASILANIHNVILGQGFQCKTELVPGDTISSVASAISKGRPQVVPELYLSNVKEAWEKGVAGGKVVTAGKIYSDGGIEGWWVPKYVVEAHPELKSIADLSKLEKLFADPDDSSKGRIYSAPAGWATETVMRNQFKAFHLEKNYTLYAPGSSAALDSAITRAYTRKEPIVSYYWSPSAIIGKFDMILLQAPPYNEEGHRCNQDPKCQHPYAGAYPSTMLVTGMTTGLKSESPAVADYLSKLSMDRATMNRMLAWGDKSASDPKTMAIYFLKTQNDVWTKWVPDDVAKRVEAYVSTFTKIGSLN
jgi:glycine betaine/proline transport system substrate-binding protein